MCVCVRECVNATVAHARTHTNTPSSSGTILWWSGCGLSSPLCWCLDGGPFIRSRRTGAAVWSVPPPCVQYDAPDKVRPVHLRQFSVDDKVTISGCVCVVVESKTIMHSKFWNCCKTLPKKSNTGIGSAGVPRPI